MAAGQIPSALPLEQLDKLPGGPAARVRHRMSTRNRLLFFTTAWLIVLMPFLFWWNTWFGRQLSDQQLTEYLNDEKHPRHIQHALLQLGDRMRLRGADTSRWYPDLVRLASHPVEEIRNTDAWIMGQDTSQAEFHEALLKLLGDSSLTVRGNAALSLVRFGDASGHAELVALLNPVVITTPVAGRVIDTDKTGTAIHQGGLVAKVEEGERTIDVRSPIAGRIHSLSVATGANVTAGAPIASVDPSTDQVWEALRGLYLIGEAVDLGAVRPYERESPDIPDRVRQQAVLTDRAITERAARP